MASERVTRILKAMSPFSAEEIFSMSDAQGRDWIYANAKPRKEKLTQVLPHRLLSGRQERTHGTRAGCKS
jgi:hypothetical protein